MDTNMSVELDLEENIDLSSFINMKENELVLDFDEITDEHENLANLTESANDKNGDHNLRLEKVAVDDAKLTSNPAEPVALHEVMTQSDRIDNALAKSQPQPHYLQLLQSAAIGSTSRRKLPMKDYINKDNCKEISKKRKYRNQNQNNSQSHINSISASPLPSKQSNRTEFVQRGPCSINPKCRDCQLKRKLPGSHLECRFKGFRKMKYDTRGRLIVAGFCSPITDVTEKEKRQWLPSKKGIPKYLGVETSQTIITQLGDRLCELLQQDKEAFKINQNANQNPNRSNYNTLETPTNDANATKKTISVCKLLVDVREMCDVCETTLFNFHWTCSQCGFVVCIACYQSRLYQLSTNHKHLQDRRPGPALENVNVLSIKDKYQWFLCSHRQVNNGGGGNEEHELSKLMLTQIIAQDCLNELDRTLHTTRHIWNIPQNCGCSEALQFCSTSPPTPTQAKIAVEKQDRSVTETSGTLKETLNSSSSSDESEDLEVDVADNSISRYLKNLSHFKKDEVAVENRKDEVQDTKLEISARQIQPKPSPNSTAKQLLPLRVWTLSESESMYPTLPHSWLCAGRLLKLEEPTHPLNLKLFQDMWKRGQPVLVANVDTKLNKSIWTPQAFSEDYGETKSDLVNCLSGRTLANQSLKKFWDGFDYVKERLLDIEGSPMLLKLKDWPAGEDFALLDPKRFSDLMAALPLRDYTDRNGRLNLAARLPEKFVKPDLGPKMYIAYGSGLHLNKGTTNLHLDISDAVNVMVHVGVPKDVDNTEHLNAVREAILDSDCDTLTIQKVTDKAKIEFAGALWHIYNYRDSDKIRDLLNKVAVETGMWLEPNRDPIHDQTYYLDRKLRKRLMEEYNVSGYPIIQCLGDAVFIPAGAPHQVRNLNNCIKIAEDFISPENVGHCFDLTEEFRRLSDNHQNREDKLQIKNVIYHAVKDAMSVLMVNQNRS